MPTGRYGAGWNLTSSSATNGKGVTGILYGSGKFLGSGSFGELGFGQLASQAIGALVICTVMLGIAYAFFKIQNALMKGGIRPTAEVEEGRIDLPEMGVLAYDNLRAVSSTSSGSTGSPSCRVGLARPLHREVDQPAQCTRAAGGENPPAVSRVTENVRTRPSERARPPLVHFGPRRLLVVE